MRQTQGWFNKIADPLSRSLSLSITHSLSIYPALASYPYFTRFAFSFSVHLIFLFNRHFYFSLTLCLAQSITPSSSLPLVLSPFVPLAKSQSTSKLSQLHLNTCSRIFGSTVTQAQQAKPVRLFWMTSIADAVCSCLELFYVIDKKKYVCFRHYLDIPAFLSQQSINNYNVSMKQNIIYNN